MYYRMISPSKARVTFRQASHHTIRTRSVHGFRYALCSPRPHSTRPSIRCYSHTHIVKDQQANMPRGTSAPFNQESWLKVSHGRLDMSLLDWSIGRPRRVVYWRCCLASTGLANFFFPVSPRLREAFTVPCISRRVPFDPSRQWRRRESNP